MRARSSLITEPTPPPSPIPTGKGSRSASNEPFDRFLDRSLRVPALASPETSIARRSVLTMVDLRSLVSGAGDSVDRILRSAKDFAAFRIVGHGISVDELRSLIGENERTLGSLERESGFGQRILWIGSRHKGLESGRRFIGDEGYRDRISVNMKHVASRLEAIAEQLNQILFKNSGEKSEQKRMFESKEYVLSLYRHYNNHQSFIDRNRVPPSHEKESQLCGDEYFLSLHLPFENCQIYVQSEMQLLPFEAGPETLVVTFGKQIEERSSQEFKYFPGKMMFLPTDHIDESRDNYSFSLELRFSFSKWKNVSNSDCKTISIREQIVIAVTINLLYKVLMFFTSQIAGA